MRTTLDLPDPVFRRLKSRAALQGMSLKALLAGMIAAGLRRGEGAEGGLGPTPAPDSMDETAPAPSAFDLMQDGAGIVRGGHRDLATDPKHLKGFGRD